MFCCTDTTLATEGNRHEIHVRIAGSGPTALHTHKIQHLHASHRQGYENGFTFFSSMEYVLCYSSNFSLILNHLQSCNFDFISFHLRNLTKSNLIHICSQQTNIKFHDHYTKSASATVQCIRKMLWLRFPSPSSCVPCMNMQPNYQLEMHFNFAKSKLSNVAVAGSFLFSFGCQFY